MPTILMATFGSHGDLLPFVALARALKARGARVVFLGNPGQAHLIEPAGVETRWVGEPGDPGPAIRRDPSYMGLRGGSKVIREIYLPFTRVLYPATLAAIDECAPDWVVSHLGCFGSIWAARARRVRNAVVHMAPLTLLTPGGAGTGSLAHYPWYARPLIRGGVPYMAGRLDGLIRPVARALGAPPLRGAWDNHFLDAMHEADRVLALFSPRFESFPSCPDPRRVLCGFLEPVQAEEALAPDLEAFVGDCEAAGEAPVVVTFGSTVVHAAPHLYGIAARALAAMGRRAVLLCDQYAPTDLPPTIRAHPYAPHEALFPRAAAVVHHGGAGTMQAAFRAGVPAVVIPFGHDQFDNALRVQHLDLGRAVAKWWLSPPRLRRALARALEPACRDAARAFGRALADEPDGAIAAADTLLAAPSLRPRPGP